ncbi:MULTISPECIES: IclR family transcriptional regulator [Halomonas]|uniref:IclR family transcriptional regulator n=1 Tax=Halomonas citrativorans TaxID=2742612 RepID=A0ABR9F788_9GAMM|nr:MULTISPECIES: IclR family transcriptional regulator [Halomonas]MBE0402353.1 IclR family transcriptional regulator [Halomonas citrativorans]HCR98866.1 transcriptional regulator [Halomonas sp.]
MEHKALITESTTAGAQSVDRALGLLSLIARQAEGSSLADLTRHSGLNKPTVRRLLLALINAGMVEQSPANHHYQLGPEAYLLGHRASEQHNLTRLATCNVARLAQRTEDAACLSIRRGHFSLCLYREDGVYPIRTHALVQGAYHPLGVGAGSLAMLAALPDAEITHVLDAQRPLLEQQYPQLAPEHMVNLVNETRLQGYAVNPGLVFADSWGIGIALRWPDGVLAGSLSLAAIESRMQEPRRSQTLVPRLKEEALAIEHLLAAEFTRHQTSPTPLARSK